MSALIEYITQLLVFYNWRLQTEQWKSE